MSQNEAADFELQINLEGIQEWDGEGGGPRLPPGIYDLEVTNAVQDIAKSSQKPVLVVTFTCINEGEHNGVSFDRKYSLQPQSLPRIKNLMMACNARLDAIRSSELIGKQIVAEVIHVEGQPQPQPDGSLKPGGTFMDVIKEMSPEAYAASQAGEAQPEPEPAPAPAPKAATKPATAAKPATAPAPTNATPKTTAVRRAVGSARQ